MSSSKVDKEEYNNPDDLENEPNLLEEDILRHRGETAQEIINHISSSKGVAVEEIGRALKMSLDNDKIKLVDPTPPQAFLSYLFSLYCSWFWAVFCFTNLALVSFIYLPDVYPFIALRYSTGMLLLLFLPGFVITESLYPNTKQIRGLEKFALYIGLSLAIVPIIGILLNYSPYELRLIPIILSLSGLVLIMGFIGVLRKYLYFKKLKYN